MRRSDATNGRKTADCRARRPPAICHLSGDLLDCSCLLRGLQRFGKAAEGIDGGMPAGRLELAGIDDQLATDPMPQRPAANCRQSEANEVWRNMNEPEPTAL